MDWMDEYWTEKEIAETNMLAQQAEAIYPGENGTPEQWDAYYAASEKVHDHNR